MEDLVKLDRARQRGLARSIECCNWEALRSPWRGAASRPVSSNVKTHVAIAGAGLGTADRIYVAVGRGDSWARRIQEAVVPKTMPRLRQATAVMRDGLRIHGAHAPICSVPVGISMMQK